MAHSSPRGTVSITRPASARLSVSATGAAATTASQSGSPASSDDYRVEEARGRQRTRRVVNGDKLSVDELEGQRHRLGSRGAPRHHGGAARNRADLLLMSGRRRDDDGPEPISAGDRGHRPGEQGPAGDFHESLRAAGSEPVSGAGGRDHGCCERMGAHARMLF